MTGSQSDKAGSESKTSSLRVSSAKSRGAAVIGLQGDLIGSEVAHFRRACGEAEREGLNNWVVDMAEVESIDGYGLASLVGLLSRARRSDGRVVLCGINPDLRKRFEATHCDSIFEIDFTVAKAVDKLSRKAEDK